jgi:hypothetical protein
MHHGNVSVVPFNLARLDSRRHFGPVGPVTSSPLGHGLEQVQCRISKWIREMVLHPRHLSGVISTNDQSVIDHLPQMLIENFLRDRREPSLELTEVNGATLELAEDWHFPLPFDQTDRELDRRLLASREKVSLPSPLIDREHRRSLST